MQEVAQQNCCPGNSRYHPAICVAPSARQLGHSEAGEDPGGGRKTLDGLAELGIEGIRCAFVRGYL
jgi:hypothetical protein